jgi:sialate O-acetylesterase
MVLQRAPQRAIVWGFGDANKPTTLRINDQTYTTMSQSEPANAQNESIWSVTLDPVSDEGPFDIHVSQPVANGTLVTITLHDILFGDVWLCSGQSNMQLTVNMIYNGSSEIANAGNYPKVRVFSAALAAYNESRKPLEELLGIALNWSVASPKSIGGPMWSYMSAVCWLYGRMIHQALDGRPIGLIATSYGGTPIQFWMPSQAVKDCNIPPYASNSALLYGSENGALQPFDEPSERLDAYSALLFNSMIYPFTRTVIYGVIWYQGRPYNLYIFNRYSVFYSRR